MTAAIRTRHANRQATRDRLIVTRSRRASTGESVVWLERPVPVVEVPR